MIKEILEIIKIINDISKNECEEYDFVLIKTKRNLYKKLEELLED